MNTYKLLSHIIAALIIALGCSSCQDDFGYDNPAYGNGEAVVSLDMSFMPFTEGNLTRSLSPTDGEAIKDLKDLAILVYDANADKDGNHVLIKECWDVTNVNGVTVENVVRTDADASGGNAAAETETARVSGYTMTLPYGRYYIIGVANLKGGTETYLKNNPDDYKTLDKMLRMRMSWDENVIANNGEMLGYFTDTSNKVVPSFETSFTPIAVNRSGMQLHSWLRRCASKITIDFDGSELRENVYIYIKEARIYDVAKDCTLGFGRPLNFSEGDVDYNNKVTDKLNGFKSPYTEKENDLAAKPYQVISYGSGEYTEWPLITKGTPSITKNSLKISDFKNFEDGDGHINFHNEKSPALYFYENMQGIHDKPGKLPVANIQDSDATPSGGLANNPKDNVAEGTFIEVVAFYHSDADGNIGTGVAKYRFMLGKDAVSDYNAERNYHYKLTLKFHGNANDYDWHINYKDRPGFNVPNPWYVSYLYNHDAMLPFKYTPDDNWELVDLWAEIETNPWYPTNLEDNQLNDPIQPLGVGTPIGDDVNNYNNPANKNNANGFLSLRVTNDVVITPEMAGHEWPTSGGYGMAEMATINEDYYLGRTKDGFDRSQRTFMKNGEIAPYNMGGAEYEAISTSLDEDAKKREVFTFQKKDDSYSFNIPLFTRAKVMVKQTGYSGNNPFVGYSRVARVILKAKVRNKTTGATRTDDGAVNVVQVRRIVNPKGVYRKSGNNEPFRVQLMWLNGDNDPDFEPVVSQGPWKAEIIGDANFITLDGKQTVSGSTNTNIDFTIRFNRMNTDNTVRNACVRVLYHNYTCTHLIFVRQGYDPIELTTSDETRNSTTYPEYGAAPVKWRTFNMISKNVEATDPRDEGSLFKYGNADEAIDAYNNIYWSLDGNGNKIYYYHNLFSEEFNTLKDNVKSPFQLADAETGELSGEDNTTSWAAIDNYNSGFTDGMISNAAQMSDFEQLYLSKNLDYGYGVLYADGATETKTNTADAYGYYRRDPDCNEKGMQGMFVYHWDGKITGGSSYNARSVFFPIGRSGYGHRKDAKEGADGKSGGNGILRYACSRGEMNSMFSDVGPLFVSIYRRPGAIYWAREISNVAREWDGTPTSNAFGLDINYFSFDVNAIVGGNISNGADACFVRCVGQNAAPAPAPRKKSRR